VKPTQKEAIKVWEYGWHGVSPMFEVPLDFLHPSGTQPFLKVIGAIPPVSRVPCPATVPIDSADSKRFGAAAIESD